MAPAHSSLQQQNIAGPSSATTMHTRQGSSPLPRHQHIASSSIHNANNTVRPNTPNRSQPMHQTKTESSISSRSTSSAFQHCSFCLLAEFDIDKGSTLSHQYPAPSGYDEHMLAELMLPDGVHARSEDWTVFFLPIEQQSDVNGIGRYNNNNNNKGSLSSTTGQNYQRKGKDRENLYCVLNLVRTKHDNTVRRGAMVKAIAIVTRHPFIHIFKPALLLALDDYFRQPGIDVLMRLFDALNSLDLAKMPQFTHNEKRILRASDRRDLFEERFPASVRSIASLRPLATTSGVGGGHADENERGKSDTYDSSTTSRLRSRSGSESSVLSGEDHPTLKSNLPHGLNSDRRTITNRPSLASLRLGSAGSNLLRRKPSSSTQMQETIGNNVRSPSATMMQEGHSANSLGVNNYPKMHMLSKVKDTHVWETSVSYGKIQELPIRVPTDVFDEEVGEYSLIHLINTFGSSHPTGPQHGHLHSNGHLTHPIILLFNAVVTGKRVIFLGHNLPAHQVAGHVLSLCALASGCGAGWGGIVSRCFPYANLGMIDELEKVPGYIAGVTNPRFEELRAWDVLCNVENGKITVHKKIEPAPAVRPNAQPSEVMKSASFSSGIGPEGETRLARAPSESEIYSSGAVQHGHNAITSKSTSRERSGSSTAFEAKPDSADNLFMDEIVLAISARYGERYVRSRFMDYAANFIRTTARHEEYYYGSTSLAPSSQPFLNGQLGSGALYADREAELKDIQINSSRIDGWRNTDAYLNLVSEVTINQEKACFVQSFDLGHQIARLRRAKKIGTSESELIFTKIGRNVRTQEQIVELLSLLPAHHGGLLPISNGLFHPSSIVQASAHEILIRIASHTIGRKMMQSLNMFHRLAFARYLSDGLESTSNSTSSYFKPSNPTIEQRSTTPNLINQKSSNTVRMNGGNPGQPYESMSTESNLYPPSIDSANYHSPIDARSRHAPSSSIGMQNSNHFGNQSNDYQM